MTEDSWCAKRVHAEGVSKRRPISNMGKKEIEGKNIASKHWSRMYAACAGPFKRDAMIGRRRVRVRILVKVQILQVVLNQWCTSKDLPEAWRERNLRRKVGS